MRAVSIPVLLAMGFIFGAAKPSSEWTSASQKLSRLVGEQYAACLVKKSRPAVMATLDAPFGDLNTALRFYSLMKGACLDDVMKPKMITAPGALEMPPLVGRGLLYEALYREDFSSNGTAPVFSGMTRIGYKFAGLEKPGSLGRDYRAFMSIGECTVRADPDRARILIMSKPASKQETAALAAIRPARLACTPPAARQLAFAPAAERGMIAEPLYRLTQASRSPAGATN